MYYRPKRSVHWHIAWFFTGPDTSTEDGNQADEERQVIFTKALSSNRGMNTDDDQVLAEEIDKKILEPVIAIRL